MSRYRLIEYKDVQENEDGSWAIGEAFKSDIHMNIEEDTPVKDICKELKDLGVLPSIDMRKISVSDTTKSIIEFRHKKSREPICRLEVNNY